MQDTPRASALLQRLTRCLEPEMSCPGTRGRSPAIRARPAKQKPRAGRWGKICSLIDI